MRLAGCTAVITGASAGIGREFARQLAGDARALILVARRIDRLEELRAELMAQNPALAVSVHAVDLSKGEEVHAVCAVLAEQNADLLINNAGVGDHGTFATSEPPRNDAMIAVNISALTTLTRAFVPGMIQRRRGCVLNVSSSASFLPLSGLGVYAASKAFVTSFSEALGMELHGTGVTVTALCPGPVDTEFGSVAARPDQTNRLGPGFTYVSTEEVVRAALAGVEHERPIVIPGSVMKLAVALLRITPMPVLRFAARFSRT